jgi:pSer/pThr/pTyr-binding forkhead associated (FHA) protein
MVSGEHCRFKYEYGRWSIEHLSRTNDTVYNGRKLEHGYEEAIRDGKVITLANAIDFIVRIF